MKLYSLTHWTDIRRVNVKTAEVEGALTIDSGVVELESGVTIVFEGGLVIGLRDSAGIARSVRQVLGALEDAKALVDVLDRLKWSGAPEPL